MQHGRSLRQTMCGGFIPKWAWLETTAWLFIGASTFSFVGCGTQVHQFNIRLVGDGSVELTSRATGDVLTQTSASCAYAAIDTGNVNQHWLIDRNQ